jgi:hypothetical protein
MFGDLFHAIQVKRQDEIRLEMMKYDASKGRQESANIKLQVVVERPLYTQMEPRL